MPFGAQLFTPEVRLEPMSTLSQAKASIRVLYCDDSGARLVIQIVYIVHSWEGHEPIAPSSIKQGASCEWDA